MSKNDNSKKDNDQQPKKVEQPKDAMDRLSKEILEECKLIATGLTESCYILVEKTKAYMAAEDKL